MQPNKRGRKIKTREARGHKVVGVNSHQFGSVN